MPGEDGHWFGRVAAQVGAPGRDGRRAAARGDQGSAEIRRLRREVAELRRANALNLDIACSDFKSGYAWQGSPGSRGAGMAGSPRSACWRCGGSIWASLSSAPARLILSPSI